MPVIIYHAGLGMPGGFVGVDVFFVISGFLITSLLLKEIEGETFSIVGFYERRARRLFPALFAVLAFTTVAALLIKTPFDLRDFAKSLVATTLFLGNFWFYREDGYFTEAAELEPLLHTWSLGVEEQFYIVFPLLLLATFRLVGHRWIFATILILTLVSLWAAVVALTKAPAAAFYLPHFRAWELFVGSLLAVAIWRGWWGDGILPPRLLGITSLVGLAAIVWPVFAYSAEIPFPGLAAVPPCLGAAILIGVGASGNSIVKRFLSLPAMVFVGKLSYSLYLWHWPIISLTYYAIGALTPTIGVFCLFLSFALSYVSWRYIETPFRDRSRFERSAILFGSIAAMTVSTTFGLAMWRLDGLPSRMDPEMLTLASSENFLHDRRDCHFVSPERARNDEVCVRGSDSIAPTFILVGDSHADAISPAIFAAAAELGMAGYQFTDAGFAPLPNVWPLGQQETEHVDALIEFIGSRPAIGTLIVTRYWLHQVTGYTYRHDGDVWVDAEYDGSGTAYNRTALRNGLTRLSTLLPERQIILLDDIPTGDALHVRSQLRRTAFFDLASLGLPTREAKEQRATYEEVLEELASTLPNVRYMPIFNALCHESICPLFEGDILLFRNGDHLSWQGALRMKEEVRDLLASLPGAPSKH